MTDAEQREAARQFVNRWRGKGNEDEDGRSYWLEFLGNVMGMENPTERVNFEKKVVVNGNTKRIDVYIPETHVIIEQKSLGKALDSKIHNSGDVDLTPYEQAKRYNDNLPYTEKARWIVTCNFSDIWIYDMEARVPEPVRISLDELQSKYPLLDFLVKKEVHKVSHEMEVSIKAGDIVGLIYEAFLKQYRIPDTTKNETDKEKSKREHKLKSLNALCVRLVFCLYAEDAGIFGSRGMFHDYLEAYEVKDCRRALIELFKTLDTPVEERDEYLEEDLAQFPYVNGGLFADETIEIPPFTDEIKQLLLTKASEDFNWRDISPTIFGAVFESTLNPETRRAGGMHYTSIENIHKVIDPLFLDDLKAEFSEISQIQVKRTKDKKLDEFQNKLASLTFLDPACGSGNFLTETYLSLRRLENEVIQEKIGGQMTLGEAYNPIKVSIQQFYGIEINDFAVTVAKTALWIAESQMLEETKSIVYGFNEDFLPLKTYVNITVGNALRIDWNDVIPANRLSYIMGNPPFIGMKEQTQKKKDDLKLVIPIKKLKQLDYVSGWYFKAVEFMKSTNIQCAFVSSNSITQGEQALTIWEPLFTEGIIINFAYRTFDWDSEATMKAHVHCVIVGFSFAGKKIRTIFENEQKILCENINQYLTPADNIFIKKSSKPICAVPEMTKGAQLIDDGHFTVGEKEDYDKLLMSEPNIKPYIRKYINGRALLNGEKPRYVLYLEECPPNVIKSSHFIGERVKAVYEYRANNSSPSTNVLKDRPSHYFQAQAPSGRSIVFSAISSGNRRYVPMAFLDEIMVLPNTIFFIDDANIYHFGVLMSNVHMAWMRTICGRLKSDYRYSNTMVYNTFPWPIPSEIQKQKIEQTAQGILEARKLFPDSSLADLYDPLTMPLELQKAHTANDKAVMAAYGFSTKMTEADCVAELMKLYKKMTEGK